MMFCGKLNGIVVIMIDRDNRVALLEYVNVAYSTLHALVTPTVSTLECINPIPSSRLLRRIRY